MSSNKLHLLEKTLAFYLKLRNDRSEHIKETEKLKIMISSFSEQQNNNKQDKKSKKSKYSKNSLIIYNSNRISKKKILIKVINNYENLKNLEPYNFKFIDANIKKRLIGFSEIRFLIIKIMLNNPRLILKSYFKNQSYYALFFKLLSNWFYENNIQRTYFFTANNRLTELLRLSSISLQVSVTEFLHGLCSDSHSKYYEILDLISNKLHSRVDYVNFLPNLPQHTSIKKRLAKYNGANMYFRNELSWNPPLLSQKIDIIVIGGNDITKSYLKTEFFKAELCALKELNSLGYTVAYCPHPTNMKMVKPYLPSDIIYGKTSEIVNSGKVIIGNFSNVLYTSKLLGKKTFIFNCAWDLIPALMKGVFGKKIDSIYGVEKVNIFLKQKTKKNSDNNTKGYDLYRHQG